MQNKTQWVYNFYNYKFCKKYTWLTHIKSRDAKNYTINAKKEKLYEREK